VQWRAADWPDVIVIFAGQFADPAAVHLHPDAETVVDPGRDVESSAGQQQAAFAGSMVRKLFVTT
jgi:hypothetical protein